MTSRPDRSERVERLTRKAKERSEATRAAAQHAILSLSNRGLPVTIKTIAAEAGVSESYLTKHAQLRDQIRALAGDQHRAPRPQQCSPATLAANQTKLIVMADRIRELEEENRGLRDENTSLRGEVLELRRAVRRRNQPDRAVVP